MNGLPTGSTPREFDENGLPVLTPEEIANGWTPETLVEYWREMANAVGQDFINRRSQARTAPPQPEPDWRRFGR